MSLSAEPRLRSVSSLLSIVVVEPVIVPGDGSGWADSAYRVQGRKRISSHEPVLMVSRNKQPQEVLSCGRCNSKNQNSGNKQGRVLEQPHRVQPGMMVVCEYPEDVSPNSCFNPASVIPGNNPRKVGSGKIQALKVAACHMMTAS